MLIKRLLAILFIALFASTAISASNKASYANPVVFADYSDPDVIRVGKHFYMVASSFHFSPGIPVLRSPDLVHWEIVGHVLPTLPFAPEYDMVPPFTLTDANESTGPGVRYGGGVWAPSIRHHRGLYYVYWATPDEGIFMSTAREPAGPWSPPVTVIDQAGLEDPCPFWDDDGSAWLIHSKVGAGPLILHRMSADGTRVLDAGFVVAEDPKKLPVLEGPKLYKRTGWYYIFAPIGGVETGSQVVGRARSLQGPYEWREVLNKGATEVQGPHQGGYVETSDGRGWFLHFNSTGAFGRVVHLQPVRWHDGWPTMGEEVVGQTWGQPVAGGVVPVALSTPGLPRLQDSDEFSGDSLGLQWEWNHNPIQAAWSLSARPGWLRMNALPADGLLTARNTLTQILQGPAMTMTVRLDLAGMGEGQRAGLSMLGIRPSWIGAARMQGITRIAFSSEGSETLGAPATGTVLLRVRVGKDERAKFSYSLDEGASFLDFGVPTTLRFSWWKGARPALFTHIVATPGSVAGNGYVDVDWVHVDVDRQ